MAQTDGHPGVLRFLDPARVGDGADRPAQVEASIPLVWAASTPHGIAGCAVLPPSTVMGLRGFEDAWEGHGTARDSWVVFDLEKLLRMLLHGSGVAFETLVAPEIWSARQFPARALASAGARAGLLEHYRDICRHLGDRRGTVEDWRALLTGWLVAEEGAVSLDLETLVGAAQDERLRPLCADEPRAPDVEVAREYLPRLAQLPATLGAEPADWAFLNDTLLSWRGAS